jgi:cytochrome c oxidase cbb3-type subunit 3
MKGIPMSNEDNKDVTVLDDEKGLLLDHNYDGIRELDHPLPFWWLVIFILTVVFSVPYFVYYVMATGETLTDEYVAEMKVVKEKQDAFEAKHGKFNVEKFNAFAVGIENDKKTRKIYKRKCKACHAADGGGGIGPNLADNYWVNGNGSPETIFKVIDKGVVDKGMEAWGKKLDRDQIYKLTAYVIMFKGTTPADPKEPQGEKYE